MIKTLLIGVIYYFRLFTAIHRDFGLSKEDAECGKTVHIFFLNGKKPVFDEVCPSTGNVIHRLWVCG